MHNGEAEKLPKSQVSLHLESFIPFWRSVFAHSSTSTRRALKAHALHEYSRVNSTAEQGGGITDTQNDPFRTPPKSKVSLKGKLLYAKRALKSRV